MIPSIFLRLLCLFAAISATSAIAAEPKSKPAKSKELRAFLSAHCYACHDDATKSGGLDLQALTWRPTEQANFDQWVEVFDRIDRDEMPPADQPRPNAAERRSFLTKLDDVLHNVNAKRQQADGRVVLRRLNRIEYENTLHDLLAIDTPLKQILPEDTPAHGFDTVAEGLRISTLQIEKYLDAADLAIDAAIQLSAPPERLAQRFSYKEQSDIRNNLDTPQGTVRDPVSGEKHQIIFKELPDAVVFFSDGYSPTNLRGSHVNVAGRYRIRAAGYGHQSRGRPVTMRVYADNWRERRLLGYFDMPADAPREVDFVVPLVANEHLKVVPYGTGFDESGRSVWEVSAPSYGGIGLAVQWVEVEGPLFDAWPPESVGRLFGDVRPTELPPNQRPWRDGRQQAYAFNVPDPSAAAGPLVERFAERAFRRPLTAGEVDDLTQLALDELDAGRTFEEAMRVAFRGVLTSPQFLLFDEQPGKLTDDALASRLSYFLWSGPPDDELLRSAVAGELTTTDGLRKQTDRLLASPRTGRFVTNFVGQWLDLRRIDATSPDSRLYPEYDELLGPAMVAETEAFFAHLLNENLPVANLIDSDFLVINRRMAEHYGIEGVNGEQFQRVSLPAGSPRGGVLTQASVLKVTANGTVTSPVMRGAWVMRRLLGQPPPPPPPVAAIEPDTRGATTIREQLAKHRDSATCASCHRTIDPPGFAMESFDVIGGWRDRYRSIELGDQPTYRLRGQGIWQYKLALPVDASGEMADGRKFVDIREFKQLLLADQRQVLTCLAEKLLTYGTGAGIEFADRRTVDQIVEHVSEQGGGVRALIHEVVQSDTFRSK